MGDLDVEDGLDLSLLRYSGKESQNPPQFRPLRLKLDSLLS